MALTPLPGSLELSATQGIDPRENMITTLFLQNQTLLEAMDKAQTVFQDTQAKQKEAVDNISKTNDDLRMALIKAEERNNELQTLHQAEIQALHEKYLLQIESQKKGNDELCKLYESVKHNLILYEQGLKIIDDINHQPTIWTAELLRRQKVLEQIAKIRNNLKILS